MVNDRPFKLLASLHIFTQHLHAVDLDLHLKSEVFLPQRNTLGLELKLLQVGHNQIVYAYLVYSILSLKHTCHLHRDFPKLSSPVTVSSVTNHYNHFSTFSLGGVIPVVDWLRT
jgi:hypothetical protein